MLQSIRSQRVGHNWTELWAEPLNAFVLDCISKHVCTVNNIGSRDKISMKQSADLVITLEDKDSKRGPCLLPTIKDSSSLGSVFLSCNAAYCVCRSLIPFTLHYGHQDLGNWHKMLIFWLLLLLLLKKKTNKRLSSVSDTGVSWLLPWKSLKIHEIVAC